MTHFRRLSEFNRFPQCSTNGVQNGTNKLNIYNAIEIVRYSWHVSDGQFHGQMKMNLAKEIAEWTK